MSEALDRLVALLDLEQLEVNLFRGVSPDEDRQRVFGGQVAGQALIAAGKTVERPVHSLHAYFLRPGDMKVPIVYQVDRLRDGRTFTTRHVTAIQHGRPIFALSASFQSEEAGLEHQASMPEAPDPESLPTFRERILASENAPPEFVRHMLARGEHPIDSRPTDEGLFWVRDRYPAESRVWIRANGQLPDDPLLHQCVATYASDMTLLETAIRPHPIAMIDEGMTAASLDHSMWFHRPFRADEWLLYAQDSWSMSNSRGFTTAKLFTRDGRLAASVAQEGFLRWTERPGEEPATGGRA
jgi:acyl-CoA thioesterase-2